MPRYTFEHKKTGETITEDMSFVDISEWLSNNPKYKRVYIAPQINYSGTGDGDMINNSPQHVEILRKIHRESPKSKLNELSRVLRQEGTG